MVKIDDYDDSTLKKFSLMLMISQDAGKNFSWLLLEDQKKVIISKLKNHFNLKSLNISSEDFFKCWINFKFGESGLIKYFMETNKNTEFIKDFKEETYLIKEGYVKDYEKQPELQKMRDDYRAKLKEATFDPFVELENQWGFPNVAFYYVKLPKLKDIEFVAIFPILTEKKSDFFEKADFIFSLVKNATLGANLMKEIIDENLIELFKQQIKTAIISILVDSFSHNISAHSLNAIIWLYLKRLEKLNGRLLIKADKDESQRTNLTKNVLDHICCREGEHKKNCTCQIVSNDEIKNISKKTSNYYDKLGLLDSTYNEKYFSMQDIISFADEDIIRRLLDFDGVNFVDYCDEAKKIPSIPVPLDNELVSFLSYLNEKSAFWNGVTRDIPSGGLITNWYEILYDFANNPLFLGTIAHSEELHRIKINIGYNDEPSEFIKIDLTSLFEEINPPQNNGILEISDYYKIINEIENFLTKIDFSEQKNPKELENNAGLEKLLKSTVLNNLLEKINKVNNSDLYNSFITYIREKYNNIIKSYNNPNYKFVTLPENYKSLREKLLEENKVFIPGGIIGKHSLFTIFENTLRNVKHANIEKNGEIVLNIKIDKVNDKPLFEISVWLSNDTNIDNESKEKINNSLQEPILTEDGRPKLGGTSQDKICAAMLFNNLFSEVESNSFFKLSENKKIMKPWISPEVNNKFVKRKFFLWQGSLINCLNIKQLRKEKDEKELIENPSRFIFSVFDLSDIENEDRYLISESGIIRILEKKQLQKNSPNKEELFKIWNNKWIKFKGALYLDKSSGGNTEYFCHVIKKENETWRYEQHLCKPIKPSENDKSIIFAHGEISEDSSKVLQYRNHGPLVENYVRSGEKLLDGELNFSRKSAGELIETLLTKIDVYDNRIYNRIKDKNKIDLFKNNLMLNVYPEECHENGKGTSSFTQYNSQSDVNIVIIHLSFIESMKGFNENNISEFITKHFTGFLSDNSKIIITTGRGRGLWWDSLKKAETSKPIGIEHILFKPIDSLLNAVQEGLVYRDDFMVKYNLLTTIFGS
ncbi:MAG: hypothetical protein JW866_09920 [Ignavibacteriales bacterium]|nr:hypothetical protein [Ignavibacteriales bacterium]